MTSYILTLYNKNIKKLAEFKSFETMELKQKASLTGFRILVVLDMLFKKPMSKNELLQEFSFENTTFKKITKETLGLDINTLKSAGFEIENTGKSGGYRYKIKNSPIKFKLSKHELKIITLTRDAIIRLADWEYILRLYRLFNKIADFIEDENQKNELINFEYFINLDLEILKTLNPLVKRKKNILLLYKSPSSGAKQISIALKEIIYSNQKLYLTGTSPIYPNNIVLRIDNILKILKILPQQNETPKQSKTPVKLQYKIKTDIKTNFEPLKNERILKENRTSLTIENKYDNDFMALQRLLGHGENLLDIKNIKMKKKYLETLEMMQKIYEEN